MGKRTGKPGKDARPGERVIYFIGIGGIGMSALARYFKSRGARVLGYDRSPSPLTQELTAEGIEVHYKDDPESLPERPDLVVYTPAVPESLGELRACRERSFPLKKRSEVLGDLSRETPSIAVAGSHGKTTISSMCAHFLKKGGRDCSAFLGGIALNYRSNYLSGAENLLVLEADEFDRSFLRLNPDCALISFMEADHLDIYEAEENVRAAFREFAQRVKPGGTLFLRRALLGELENESVRIRTYGLDPDADYRAMNIRTQDGGYVFDFFGPDGLVLRDLVLRMGGKQNVENAAGALGIALEHGAAPESLPDAVSSFLGIERRFAYAHLDNRLALIDDYAHHPTELTATIRSARELFPERELVAVFQPHLFTRTRDFARGFAASLDEADRAYLLPVYPAREEPLPGVDSGLIYDAMKLPEAQKRLVPDRNELPGMLLRDLSREGGRKTPLVVLLAGAGDVNLLAPELKQSLPGI